MNESNPNDVTHEILGVPGSAKRGGPPELLDRNHTERVGRKRLRRTRFSATFWFCNMPGLVVLGACLLRWDGVPLSWSLQLQPDELFLVTICLMMLIGPFVYVIQHGIDHGSVWRAVRRSRYTLRAMFLVFLVVALDLSLIRWFGWDYSPEAKLVLFLAGIFYAGAMVGFIYMMVEDFVPRSRR